jgi:uracil-DNA glycosylase
MAGCREICKQERRTYARKEKIEWPQVQQICREKRSQRLAQKEAWHAEIRETRSRRQGEEPQAGHRDWPLRSAKEGRKSSEEAIQVIRMHFVVRTEMGEGCKSQRGISPTRTQRKAGEQSVAAELIPQNANLGNLRAAAENCRACDLWRTATQTVFGEGLVSAKVMLIGEQPGDQEDRKGHPFIGPAGRVLDEALAAAGIERSKVYVTNVVKHFKWAATERGKRRIHKKPRYSEIQACLPWLDAELQAVRPEVVVCLGASAAQALLGKDFRVTRDRGNLIPSSIAPKVVATVHPSSILRAHDDDSRHQQMQAFIRDLRQVARLLNGQPRSNKAA